VSSGSPSCSTSEALSSPALQGDVAGALGGTVAALTAAAVRDVQNALLSGNSPFPGERTPTGQPAVCSSP